MSDRSALRAVLDLEPVGEGRFRAANVATGVGGVVFGGQLLAQTIVAAASVDPAKELKTVHTVFARGASPDRPLDIEVEDHARRSGPGQRRRHRPPGGAPVHPLPLPAERGRAGPDPPWPRTPRRRGRPREATGRGREGDFWEIRVVGGVDIADPEAVGPPELLVWSRFPGSDETGVIGQALLAYATDGFLIGTAMRPHPGIGQSMAHVSISTSVLSHTLTFHEPVEAGAWHLLAHHSPYAGRGRSYGRADIFTVDGRLVASFVQDNMIRAFAEGQGPAAGGRAKH